MTPVFYYTKQILPESGIMAEKCLLTHVDWRKPALCTVSNELEPLTCGLGTSSLNVPWELV